MSTASATALPAATIIDAVDEFIEAGSLSVGARLTVIAHLAAAARRRGLDPEAPIDGDVLDEMIMAAVPTHLWMFA